MMMKLYHALNFNGLMSKIIRLAIPLSILFLLPTLLLSQSRTGPQIKWMTWTEAMEKMATDAKPKKIMVDLYTDWCGYCKKMDRETFRDPLVVAYINEHFYPVKFDAEQRESLRYADHTFKYDPNKGRRGVHSLAFALTDGRMSYPSMVYLDESQKRIAISPGFKPADSFLRELRFIGDNHYKVTDYNTYVNKRRGE